jgi:hypothetical protein
MIVSHKHRFIFIKSQRTGGTSLELALSTICGPDDIVPPLPRHEKERSELGGLSPRNFDVPIHRHRREDWRLILQGRGRRAFWSHVDARDTRAWLPPRVWKDYFKFAVERNPWDRAISFYWRLHPDVENRPAMAEFLRELPQRMISNVGFYSIGDEIVVDHVMRYERLSDEVKALCDRLGIESRLDLPRAKSGTRKDRRPYREVLQPEEREIIARRCAREIELLGYEF